MSPASGKTVTCTLCDKPVDKAYRPFCSKRCADIDLGRWLGERYSIPALEPPDGGFDDTLTGFDEER